MSPKNKASSKSFKLTSQSYHYKDLVIYTPFYQDIRPTKRANERTHLGWNKITIPKKSHNCPNY